MPEAIDAVAQGIGYTVMAASGIGVAGGLAWAVMCWLWKHPIKAFVGTFEFWWHRKEFMAWKKQRKDT